MEKIRGSLPEAVENESWELQDGQSYDPYVFTKPDATAKFFNKRVTFSIDMSFTTIQVKSAFSNAMQMNGLMSMIRTNIENSMTIKTDALIMRTINAAIAETVFADYGDAGLSTKSGVKAVNLLYLYNNTVNTGTDITAAQALTDSAFMRFATLTIKNYMSRMSVISTLFNIGGTEKFTPRDMMHVVMLDVFKNSVESYLYDGLNQFNTDAIKLPENVETVPYWQGSGTGYAWDDVSKIMVTTPSGHAVTVTGVLAGGLKSVAVDCVTGPRNRLSAYPTLTGVFFPSLTRRVNFGTNSTSMMLDTSSILMKTSLHSLSLNPH